MRRILTPGNQIIQDCLHAARVDFVLRFADVELCNYYLFDVVFDAAGTNYQS